MTSKTVDQKAVQASSPRQWIGLIAAYLSMPLILFVCGGDFGWWQAWVYTLLIVVIGVGGRILGERRHPGLTAERQNAKKIQDAKAWDKVLAPLMALSIGYPLMIVAGLDHRFGWSPVFPLWLIVLGFLLIALGYAFSSWAFVENRFFSSLDAERFDMDRYHTPHALDPFEYAPH